MVQLPFLSKPKENDDRFLVLDINTSEVKCLALYLENDSVKIIGHGQKNIDKGVAKSGFVIDMEYMALCLEEVIAQACQNCEHEINKVIVGAPTDLCIGLMTTVRSKRKKGKPIDKKELNIIYDKLREAAIMQAQKDYLETTGDDEVNLDMVTEATVYAKVDNVHVKDLEGELGTVIETAVFNAFCPKSYLTNVQAYIKKAGLQLLTIAPEIYGLVKTVLSTDRTLTDFVLIDIANDSTNVAVVFGKGIISTKFLNIGTQHFAEGVMDRMGLNYREADKLMKSYVTGQLTQTEATVIRESLHEVMSIWLNGLEILFNEYSGVKTFPSQVYLAGLGAEFQDLWNLITSQPWTRSVPFKEPPVYKKVSFLDMPKTVDSTGKISGADWLSVAALSTVYLEMKGIDND